LDSPHDSTVRRLQELRQAAGEPSYASIARAVAALRIQRGVKEEAALPPRTTVYDAFRLGRRRLDYDLVADLTSVLNAAAAARPSLATPAAPVADEAAGDAEVDVPPDGSSPSRTPEPHDPVVETVTAARDFGGPTVSFRVKLAVIALIVNFAGMFLMRWLQLPIYLDMIGTALAAVVLGPWWGVGVSFAAAALHDGILGSWWMVAFSPVSAAGALMWGYGARRWGAARSIARFLRLTLWVSVVCTFLSLPPLIGTLGRWPSHPEAVLTQVMIEYLPYWAAVLVANGFFVLLDKIVTAFIALALLDAWRARWPWVVPMLDGDEADHHE
jgi:energy-coupling factor transport system substrate-specific component